MDIIQDKTEYIRIQFHLTCSLIHFSNFALCTRILLPIRTCIFCSNVKFLALPYEILSSSLTSPSESRIFSSRNSFNIDILLSAYSFEIWEKKVFITDLGGLLSYFRHDSFFLSIVNKKRILSFGQEKRSP